MDLKSARGALSIAGEFIADKAGTIYHAIEITTIVGAVVAASRLELLTEKVFQQYSDDEIVHEIKSTKFKLLSTGLVVAGTTVDLFTKEQSVRFWVRKYAAFHAPLTTLRLGALLIEQWRRKNALRYERTQRELARPSVMGGPIGLHDGWYLLLGELLGSNPEDINSQLVNEGLSRLDDDPAIKFRIVPEGRLW